MKRHLNCAVQCLARVVWMSTVMLGSTIALAAGPDIKPGEWAYTVSLEVPGAPIKMPPQRFVQCVTPEEAIPQQTMPKDVECKTVSRKITGNAVRWEMHCTHQGTRTEMSGDVRYARETMDGKIQQRIITPGAPAQTMSSTIQGKWLGPCPQKK